MKSFSAFLALNVPLEMLIGPSLPWCSASPRPWYVSNWNRRSARRRIPVHDTKGFRRAKSRSPYLLQIRPQLVGRPARSVPGVEIRTLGACVHHPVDGRPTAQSTSGGDNRVTVGKLWRLVSLPEQGRRAAFVQVSGEQSWVDHERVVIVVQALFDQQDRHLRVGLRQPRCDHAASASTWSTE